MSGQASTVILRLILVAVAVAPLIALFLAPLEHDRLKVDAIALGVVLIFALVGLIPWPRPRPRVDPHARPEQSDPVRLERIKSRMTDEARVGLLLRPAETPVVSKIGGAPDVSGFDWPTCEGAPLEFIAQIDLAEARAAGGPDWLPDSGLLMFFFSLDVYADGIRRAGTPYLAVIFLPGAESARAEAHSNVAAPEKRVEFLAVKSPLPACRADDDWRSVPTPDLRALWKFEQASRGEGPIHKIGGFANAIQGDDMEEECEAGSRGLRLYGPNPFNEELKAAIAEGANDWRLLLQVDTDDDVDMMWGDAGRLYFWIRERDVRARDFSQARVTAQCY